MAETMKMAKLLSTDYEQPKSTKYTLLHKSRYYIFTILEV